MRDINPDQQETTIPLRSDPDWQKRKKNDPEATVVGITPTEVTPVTPGEAETVKDTQVEQITEVQEQPAGRAAAAHEHERATEKEENRELAQTTRLSAEMSAIIIAENPERLTAEQAWLKKEQILREGKITETTVIRTNKEADLKAAGEAQERIDGWQKNLKRRDATEEEKKRAQEEIDRADTDLHEALRISSEVTAYLFQSDETKLAAAYKPADGEPESYGGVPKSESYRREWLTSLVGRALEADLTPATVIRKINGRIGSVQEWRDGEDAYGTDWKEKINREQLELLASFHYLIWALDGHESNFLIDENFNITAAIDNGMSFPVDESRRRFKSDPLEAITGQPLTQPTIDKLGRLRSSPARLGTLEDAFFVAFGRSTGTMLWRKFLDRLDRLVNASALPQSESLYERLEKH